MSIYWIVGSIYFYFTREIRYSLNKKPDINVDELEGITFLLACYNESETIEDTLSNVLALKYEKKEIIIINDGSSDNTAELIYKIKENNDFIFVDLQENRGKANALNQGIKQASYDYVMCLDADTIVDRSILCDFLIHWYVYKLIKKFQAYRFKLGIFRLSSVYSRIHKT